MLQAKNLFFLVIFMLLTTTKVAAQQGSLSGRVIDSETREAMVRTTLQLYRIGQKDTTFVKGVFSDANGRFTISSVNAGNYLLKLSYLGYKTLSKNVTVARRAISMGDISMESDAVQLKEAVVTANIPKMVIKDDTVVYNADAFRVPEGSVIEALVEMLPGAKVDDDGKISIKEDISRTQGEDEEGSAQLTASVVLSDLIEVEEMSARICS